MNFDNARAVEMGEARLASGLVVGICGGLALLVISAIQVGDYRAIAAWSEARCLFTGPNVTLDARYNQWPVEATFQTQALLAGSRQWQPAHVGYPPGHPLLNTRTESDVRLWVNVNQRAGVGDCLVDFAGAAAPHAAVTQNVSPYWGWGVAAAAAELLACLVLLDVCYNDARISKYLVETPCGRALVACCTWLAVATSACCRCLAAVCRQVATCCSCVGDFFSECCAECRRCCRGSSAPDSYAPQHDST